MGIQIIKGLNKLIRYRYTNEKRVEIVFLLQEGRV